MSDYPMDLDNAEALLAQANANFDQTERMLLHWDKPTSATLTNAPPEIPLKEEAEKKGIWCAPPRLLEYHEPEPTPTTASTSKKGQPEPTGNGDGRAVRPATGDTKKVKKEKMEAALPTKSSAPATPTKKPAPTHTATGEPVRRSPRNNAHA